MNRILLSAPGSHLRANKLQSGNKSILYILSIDVQFSEVNTNDR